ncbi:hypothetical protein [Burkholderia sp. Bp9004]|uniref:hypothetical protein n=1 Tax=Burkholderia sp. Bp9004 TaxID=2184559 RepID=UPI000F604241|nr:hypothetical protein [Burkholderia sp. Bp9004]
MPISEKTVELNVSRTIIEKMRRTHQINAYAIGATQAQEQQFGFDVLATDGSWCGGFIQYKRLYANGNINRWNLNRTKYRDQHSILCAVEALGYPVFYCFPKFDSETTLRQWTPPSLWSQVWWIQPSAIPVPSPVDAHHHVTYDNATGVWQVYSDEGTEFDPGSADFSFVEKRMLDLDVETHSLERLKGSVREIMETRWKSISQPTQIDAGKSTRGLTGYMSNVSRGLGLIAFQLEEYQGEHDKGAGTSNVRVRNTQGVRQRS